MRLDVMAIRRLLICKRKGFNKTEGKAIWEYLSKLKNSDLRRLLTNPKTRPTVDFQCEVILRNRGQWHRSI